MLPQRKKFKAAFSGGKIVASMFWDAPGLLRLEVFALWRDTITVDRYSATFRRFSVAVRAPGALSGTSVKTPTPNRRSEIAVQGGSTPTDSPALSRRVPTPYSFAPIFVILESRWLSLVDWAELLMFHVDETLLDLTVSARPEYSSFNSKFFRTIVRILIVAFLTHLKILILCYLCAETKLIYLVPLKVLLAFGAAVAERLDCSPPTMANRFRSPVGPLPDFRKWESCRTMPLVGGFSRGFPVSPPLYSGAVPFSPHFTLIGSQHFVRMKQCWNARAGERDIPEKTRRPAASSGTIPICENPE
ncbi:hypothetical protein PR048_003477 [Dryococelus australis]|uniref:Uncharacterized protein n=1 Tax=Dryococelus australis TaxID=614101 RepID=A0ABQ9INN8_9NEOP|nr:hypothetical protein PR048_003477 [Dryococelus australis]